MANKQYGNAEFYEGKLTRVMERFGATTFNYNWDRFSAFIEFYINGQLYRFDHSVEKAQANGLKVKYGSDIFAQLVLALEDLARIAERGIYNIETWISGMKFLPPPVMMPQCLIALGFTEIPATIEDVQARFKTLAKQAHPDCGGDEEAFVRLQNNAKQAIEFLEKRSNYGTNNGKERR